MTLRKGITTGATALLFALSAGFALADGMPSQGSVKDAAPAAEERKFTWGWNIGGTSDYIFRGISQNGRNPTLQGGFDASYGIAYMGVWSSGIDFGQNRDIFPGRGIGAVAGTEVDLYGGIKPVWGPLNFDIGVIYYWYPAENAHGPKFFEAFDNNYVEGKFGVSGTPITNLTTGVTLYVSPNYTGNQGVTEVVEGTAAYELPHWRNIVPTIGGTLGGVFGDSSPTASHRFTAANGSDSYLYWNAGLTLGFDKLSIDFRYWDTDINNRTAGGVSGFCTGNGAATGTSNHIFQCDSRFVATAKVTF